MYTGCDCIKRNGLQHDCRRTGCQGEPPCLVSPDPMCAPSQLARAHGLADPAPLAKHLKDSYDNGGGTVAKPSGSGPRRKFIVCEMKAQLEPPKTGGACCEFGSKDVTPLLSAPQVVSSFDQRCLAEVILQLQTWEKEDAAAERPGGGGQRRGRQRTPPEPCTTPGCQHWKPPPKCVWPKPCPADCFEHTALTAAVH